MSHTRRSFVVVLFLSCVGPASATCIEIWAKGLNDPGGPTAKRSLFKPDERALVCVRIGETKLVSVWDTPPQSNPTRLFPNRFSTPDDQNILASRVEANKTLCFGDRSSFPLFFDKRDGLGSGRLSVVATDRMEDQFAPSDFVIPGRQIKRSALEAKEKLLHITPKCSSKMRDEFKYRVAE